MWWWGSDSGFGAWGYYHYELGFCFGFTWFARYGTQNCLLLCFFLLQIWWIGRPITTNGVCVFGGEHCSVIVLFKTYPSIHPQFSHPPQPASHSKTHQNSYTYIITYSITLSVPINKWLHTEHHLRKQSPILKKIYINGDSLAIKQRGEKGLWIMCDGLVIVILGLERGWGGEGKERENNGVGKYSIFLGRVAVAEAERQRYGYWVWDTKTSWSEKADPWKTVPACHVGSFDYPLPNDQN